MIETDRWKILANLGSKLSHELLFEFHVRLRNCAVGFVVRKDRASLKKPIKSVIEILQT